MKNRSLALVGLLLSAFLLGSCEPGKIDLRDAQEWSAENVEVLDRESEVSNYLISSKFKPWSEGSAGEMLSFRDGVYQFELTFKRRNASANEFRSDDYYFLFDLQQDIELKVGEQTYPCTMYHMQRDYGLTGYSTIHVGFDLGGPQEGDMQLIITPRPLQIGSVKLVYTKEDMAKIPDLKSNS